MMSERAEIVIGFVGPIGVRLSSLVAHTSEALKSFKYDPVEIRLSKLLEERFIDWESAAKTSEDARIRHNQKMGRLFREKLNDPAAFVLAAMVSIREERAKRSGSHDKPSGAVAYLLNQLKHPNEVKLLREIYGPSFLLIAAHATQKTRQDHLVRLMADSENRSGTHEDAATALEIIRIDDEESGLNGADDLGQNTRNTYPLADLFVNFERDSGKYEIDRFIDLLFGHPFHTPRPDEVAMYHAAAAALRSSDDSRQVGAVIVDVRRDGRNQTSNVEVIATGMNEVPMRGGGFYWDGSSYSPDARDQWLIARWNDDRALSIKKGVLTELLEIFKRKEWFNAAITATQTPELLRELIPKELKGTQFLNIGEFQRQVHAEMAALLDSARRGIAVDNRTMFVTTFPCHNCAKHIIAAGIKHVVYLEPYPKSRAESLHKEEIDLDSWSTPTNENPKGDSISRVVFSPYAGIAPRQYQRLFNMSGRGKKALFNLKDWEGNKDAIAPQYLIRNAFASYILAERQELSRLPAAHFNWEPEVVCPT